VRILFDQGTPAPLRQSLTAHSVSTSYEMSWSALANGDLLDAAEAQFDVFVTTDQNLRYQQNLSGRQLAILVLPYASWPKLQRHLPAIVAAIETMTPGGYLELSLP
jgi:hypothetical protein